MNNKYKNITARIREVIKAVDPKARIILFGSRARGNAKKDSDWDILILTDSPDTIDVERSFRYNLYELELETGEVFSTFIHNKKNWNTKHKVTPFYKSIKKEGIIL